MSVTVFTGVVLVEKSQGDGGWLWARVLLAGFGEKAL